MWRLRSVIVSPLDRTAVEPHSVGPAIIGSTPGRSRADRAHVAFLLEYQLRAAAAYAYSIPGHELVAQDALRKRILDLLLDRALQRPRAVHRIEARLADQIARLVIQVELHIAIEHPPPQVVELDFHDRANLLGAQRMEHDDVVDAVDELGPEVLLHGLHHGSFHARVVAFPGHFLDRLRAQVRGHDDDRVAEI